MSAQWQSPVSTAYQHYLTVWTFLEIMLSCSNSRGIIKLYFYSKSIYCTLMDC